MAKKNIPPITTPSRMPVGNSIGNRLFSALTQKEVADLLDQLFENISEAEQQAALLGLPIDTRRTIEQILTPESPTSPTDTAKEPLVSLAKQAEQWRKLWSQWDKIIETAGDEGGEYFTQEEDWEPPYFDEYALVADLEGVGTQMRPLLQIAFENRFAPHRSFAEATFAIEDEVNSGLPDWIEITEGFHLEKDLTYCVLEWERLTTQKNGDDAFKLAELICELEDEFRNTTLDETTLFDFFAALPMEDRQSIFDGMSREIDSELWRTPLRSAHSVWHSLYLHFIEEFSPEQRLVLVRQTIPQRWQNGLQVIEHHLSQNETNAALAVLKETIASMVSSLRSTIDWNPESTLLKTILATYFEEESKLGEHKKLLQYYERCAQALGQTNLANSLAIQSIALNHIYDWQRMLKAFDSVSITDATKQSLFQSWRDYIVSRSQPNDYGFGYNRIHSGGWVEWLLNSIIDPTKGAKWFQTKVASWLTSLPEIKQPTGADYAHLRLLTRDLAIAFGLPTKTYQYFYADVILFKQLATADDASRHAYLRQFAASDLHEQLLIIWRNNLPKLMPNPGSVSNGEYSHHAHWLAALREIAPEAHTSLLPQWRRDFQRRRNLWTALEQVGIR